MRRSIRLSVYLACVLQKHTNSVRVGLIHNPVELPSSGEKQERLSIAVAVQAAIDSLSSAMAKSFVTKLLKEENVAELHLGTRTLQDLAVHVSSLSYSHHSCLSLCVCFSVCV